MIEKLQTKQLTEIIGQRIPAPVGCDNRKWLATAWDKCEREIDDSKNLQAEENTDGMEKEKLQPCLKNLSIIMCQWTTHMDFKKSCLKLQMTADIKIIYCSAPVAMQLIEEILQCLLYFY